MLWRVHDAKCNENFKWNKVYENHESSKTKQRHQQQHKQNGQTENDIKKSGSLQQKWSFYYIF